jgi:ammonium transporter Rh
LLHHHLQLHDTCGIHNLHGIPGLIGGLISAMVVASFQTYPGLDSTYSNYVSFTPNGRSYSGQAGIQVAGTFVSLGIGIAFGILTGFIISLFYDFHNS